MFLFSAVLTQVQAPEKYVWSVSPSIHSLLIGCSYGLDDIWWRGDIYWLSRLSYRLSRLVIKHRALHPPRQTNHDGHPETRLDEYFSTTTPG